MKRITVLVLALLPGVVRAATLEGVVVDTAGRPIAGARVDIVTAAPRQGQALFCPSCYLDCAKWTETDHQGRYQIVDLNDALKFRVLFTATGKKPHLTDLLDPLAGAAPVKLAAQLPEGPANRILSGRVVDDQGLAVAGALVWPVGAKTASRRWFGEVEKEPTVCDSEGRFTFLLPEELLAVDLEITADGMSGSTVPELEPGSKEHEISLPTGTRVTGQLVHDGAPVEGLVLAMVQLERDTGHHFIKAVSSTTDSTGRFDFNYLPANERYAIYTLVGEGSSEVRDLVLSTKLLTARNNRATRDLGQLKAQPALRLKGKVELPDGQSLPAASMLVLSRDPAWDLIATPLEKDGTFEISGLPPEVYEVRVAAKGLSIDPAGLEHQSLGPQSFGLRLEASQDDLRIQLKKD